MLVLANFKSMALTTEEYLPGETILAELPGSLHQFYTIKYTNFKSIRSLEVDEIILARYDVTQTKKEKPDF